MAQKAVFPTACKTCRLRGKRCDRTLPACMSCTQRGVVCDGYVTRWVGLAARGKLAGEILPNSRKKGAKCLRQSFLAQSISTSPVQPLRSPKGPASSGPQSIPQTASLPLGDQDDCASRQRESDVESNSALSTLCCGNNSRTTQQQELRICMNALPDVDNLQGLIHYCERFCSGPLLVLTNYLFR